MKRQVFALFVALLGCVPLAFAAPSGAEALVIFNSSMPESRDVATYYASKRQVPPANVIGLDLPKTETMSREEFTKKLQEPLIAAIEKNGFWKYHDKGELPIEAKVRFAALCYGVPLKITPADLKEKPPEKLPKELQRNEASVEGELALLPLRRGKHELFGPFQNPAYGTTNRHLLHPTNGVFMVTRLDGPSPEIAKGLVDKAMLAEKEGLWGRGYFDLRGIAEGDLAPGDDFIKRAAHASALYGFDTYVNNTAETLPASYPLSNVALYAGWYDPHVSGPFTRTNVDFMPGAIAYHLHSYSAATVRVGWENWVGPLLARGVTATMGTVYEPYLGLTPHVGLLLVEMLHGGRTFGEAAIVCQPALSWQSTFVGDPLYQPAHQSFKDQFEGMLAAKSKNTEWGHIKVLNLGGATNSMMVNEYLRDVAGAKNSAVLQEKLGDVLQREGNLLESVEPYERVLKLSTNAQQRLRVALSLGDSLTIFGRQRQAFEVYQGLIKDHPDYPDRLVIYEKLVQLGEALGRKADVDKYKAEIETLKKAEKKG
ncbi:MAG TPA: TIGR03790 family protein [Methylomirabilota bacterium]|nr:TIGR03790 family protein [Methylomirabilota bacterium]